MKIQILTNIMSVLGIDNIPVRNTKAPALRLRPDETSSLSFDIVVCIGRDHGDAKWPQTVARLHRDRNQAQKMPLIDGSRN
jgi:hypothetical protein